MKKALLIVLTIFMTQSAYAMNEQQFQAMIKRYVEALDGNHQSRDDVKQMLGAIIEEDKSDAIAHVFYGSTMTLEGRDAWMPWNKMGLTEKGMDIMDRALKMSKGNDEIPSFLNRAIEMEVKTLCAFTFTQVPKMFGRFEQGIELFDEIRLDPRYRQFTDLQKAQFLFYRAKAAASNDHLVDAKNYYQKVIRMNVSEKLSKQSNEELERLSL